MGRNHKTILLKSRQTEVKKYTEITTSTTITTLTNITTLLNKIKNSEQMTNRKNEGNTNVGLKLPNLILVRRRAYKESNSSFGIPFVSHFQEGWSYEEVEVDSPQTSRTSEDKTKGSQSSEFGEERLKEVVEQWSFHSLLPICPNNIPIEFWLLY